MKIDPRLRSLVKRAVRYGTTGVFVTFVHACIVVLVMERFYPVASVANGIAFLVATTISYLINTHWSYSSSITPTNLVRFATVTTIGLILSMTVSGLAQRAGLFYGWGVAMVVCVVPPVTFTLHTLWTYRLPAADQKAA